MKLLPFRDYSEHDVINGLFSTVEGTIEGGTLVSIATSDPACRSDAHRIWQR